MFERRQALRVRSSAIRVRIQNEIIPVEDLSTTGAWLACSKQLAHMSANNSCEIMVNKLRVKATCSPLTIRDNKPVIVFPEMSESSKTLLQQELKELFIQSTLYSS